MRDKKIIMVALIMAVISLTVGFAAFSSSLNISSTADVKPNSSDFDVCFSETGTSCSVQKTITPTVVGSNVYAPLGFVVYNTFWTVSDSQGTNKSIGFTEPGESVTYNMYVRNTGKYTAYLNEIIFNDANASNVDGSSSFKVCISTSGSTPSLMNAACRAISATVTVNNGTKTETATNATKSGIDGFSLAPGSTATVTIKFEYAANGTRADGSFNVSFGDIKFNYSTVD